MCYLMKSPLRNLTTDISRWRGDVNATGNPFHLHFRFMHFVFPRSETDYPVTKLQSLSSILEIRVMVKKNESFKTAALYSRVTILCVHVYMDRPVESCLKVS